MVQVWKKPVLYRVINRIVNIKWEATVLVDKHKTIYPFIYL